MKLADGATNTEIKDFGNGWHYLLENDGYTVILKSFTTIDNKRLTVVIDNWSVTPIGLQDYDVNDLVVDTEWEEVFCNHRHAAWNDYESGFKWIKENMGDEIFNDVVSAFSEYIDIEHEPQWLKNLREAV